MLESSLRRDALPLNAIRLVLALLVLVSHCYPLGGYAGDDPFWWPGGHLGTTLGGFAVGAFFALSGMLVTMSAKKKSVGQYFGARARRIYPAYLVVLLFGAVVLAPVIYQMTHGSLTGYFHWGPEGPVTYVLHNALFPLALQYGINDVFATTTPFGLTGAGSVINGSLWTLPLEVRCYVVAVLVALVGRFLGPGRVATAALVLSGGLVALAHFRPEAANALAPEYFPVSMFELLFVFMCGALAGALSHRLRLSAPLVVSAFVVLGVATVIGGKVFTTVGLGSLCLVIPAVAAVLPLRSVAVLRNDLSYGCYVWAFPVQQTLAFLHVNEQPLAVFMGVSAVLTLVAAGLSWRFVEAPSLNRRRPAPTAAPPGEELAVVRT